MNHRNKIARMFLDIETSPNVVFSWSTGFKLTILPENIVKERAIICLAYKWEGEKVIHSLSWDNGDDRAMLEKFIPILEQAQEVVGHNSDRFDLPWIRTRCIYHGIPVSPNIVGVDTLKLARKSFRFNSNKLSYITQFLGLNRKIQVGYNLWKQVILGNDPVALKKMVRYCKQDVKITEEAYNKLQSYGPYRTHVGVLAGGLKTDCVRCASNNTQKRGTRVSAAGVRNQIMSCNDCGRHFTANMTAVSKWEDVNED